MTNVKKMTTIESMTIESKVLNITKTMAMNYDADVDAYADTDADDAGAGAGAGDDADDAVDCNNNEDGCANACD